MKRQTEKNCIGKKTNALLNVFKDNNQLQFTKNEIDFAYLVGAFNAGGINALNKELNRVKELKELKKELSDMIITSRNEVLN